MPTTTQPRDARQYGGVDIRRLDHSYRRSKVLLKAFRDHRIQALKEIVGPHYGSAGAPAKNVMNMLELAIQTYLRMLSAGDMRVLVEARYRRYAADAKALQIGGDELLRRLEFGKYHKKWVFDALIGLGVLKTGLNVGQEIEVQGEKFVRGQPYARVVDLDDFAVDMNAKTWDDVTWEAHEYYLPAEMVENSPVFNRRAIKNLRASSRQAIYDGFQRAHNMTAETWGDVEDTVEFYRLVDIYLPMHGWFMTLGLQETEGFIDGPPLVSKPYVGPPGGPFTKLWFTEIPGNLFPLPPSMTWLDGHLDVNRQYRKASRQADRSKRVYPFPQNAKEDAAAFMDARDGAGIAVKNTLLDRIKPLETPGPNPNNFAFMMETMRTAFRVWGNIEAIGGLGPQSDTLGQDQLLYQQASRRIEEMQDRTIAATTIAIDKLLWYLKHDPFIEWRLAKRVEGINIPFVFRPADLETDHMAYITRLHPYSLVRQTPEMKLRRLLSLFQEFILPASPMMAQQGIHIDWEELMSKVAEYSGLEEMRDILSLSDIAGMPPGMPPAKSPVTRRETVRRNVSGTPQQNDAAMVNLMMRQGGANAGQAAQAASPEG